jgi:hypothetical protein
MTNGDLASAVRISRGATIALVDRLEQAGLATRRADPTNRHRVLVQPSRDPAARAYVAFAPLMPEASNAMMSRGGGVIAARAQRASR